MRNRLLPLVLAFTCLAAVACGPAGGGGGPKTPDASATPREILAEPTSFPPGVQDGATLVAQESFNGTANFVDPVPEELKATKNYLSGRWEAVGGVYAQTAPGPSTKLAIQRYNGDAFNPGGVMGDRYRVEVTAWQYRFVGTDPAKDTSVLVLIPYYKDESHYVIGSASPQLAEVWVSDGYEPGKPWPAGKLWSAGYETPLVVGNALTWSFDVDTVAKTLTTYTNGQKRSTVTLPSLESGGFVALGSNGNQVKFKDFKLFRLP